MCLDLEHYLKVEIINSIQESHPEEAYIIVREYIDSQDPLIRKQLKSSINPAEHKADIYKGSLMENHFPNYPVWAFLEIVKFADLIYFYSFVRSKYECSACNASSCFHLRKGECDKIKRINRQKKMLHDVRSLRNAAAHNSCILNDLHYKSNMYFAQIEVKHHVYEVVPKEFAKHRLEYDRVRQIITLFHMYGIHVTSDTVKSIRYKEARHIFCERFMRHIDYFHTNAPIKKTFEFLEKVIDKWCAT